MSNWKSIIIAGPFPFEDRLTGEGYLRLLEEHITGTVIMENVDDLDENRTFQ